MANMTLIMSAPDPQRIEAEATIDENFLDVQVLLASKIGKLFFKDQVAPWKISGFQNMQSSSSSSQLFAFQKDSLQYELQLACVDNFFARQILRLTPPEITEGSIENVVEADEVMEKLRLERLKLIQHRRQIKSKLFYYVSSSMQRDVKDTESKIRQLNEQMMARRQPAVDFDEMFAELKRGNERLSKCIERLESQHDQNCPKPTT